MSAVSIANFEFDFGLVLKAPYFISSDNFFYIHVKFNVDSLL
jgi:hypothetical protein